MITGSGQTAQDVTLTQGLVDLTSGVYEGVNSARCTVGGDLKITWKSGETTTTTRESGFCSSVECFSLEIVSGTWDLFNLKG